MLANQKFTMRVTPEDRQYFAELKRLFKRSSESDAIRHVVRETVKAFQKLDREEKQAQRGNAHKFKLN